MRSNETFRPEIKKWVSALRFTAIGLCLGLMVVGLWPFHAPKNQVSWSSQGNGLVFGTYGSVVSAGTFTSYSKAHGPCSVEICLEPHRADSGGTILAFYQAASRVIPFEVRQFVNGLMLRSQGRSEPETHLYVDKVFSQPKPIFLSIT